jgi:hypothetical protein
MRRASINTRPWSADESCMDSRKLALVKPEADQEQKIESKIDYRELEAQRSEAIQERLKIQLRAREVGKNASLRRVVLRFVADGKYNDANMILDEYLQLKAVFPQLRDRSKLHVIHAKELINAIRAKRNFPNLSQLAMSKQQEILDHAIAHFEELKQTLRMVEAMVKDEAIRDMRSTIWVLRSLVYFTMLIVLTTFITEFSGSMGKPLWVVFNDFADNSFKFLMALF